MATDNRFNPEETYQQPETLGYARRIEAPRAKEVPTQVASLAPLVEGVGKTLEGAVKIGDDFIKKYISETVDRTVAGPARGPETKGPGLNDLRLGLSGDPDTIPDELANKGKDLEKLNKARVSGGISDTAFMGTAYQMVKNLKKQFGYGYYDYIDEMADKATGYLTVASKLDRALKQAQEGVGSKNTEQDKWVLANMKYISPAFDKVDPKTGARDDAWNQYKRGALTFDQMVPVVGRIEGDLIQKQTAAADIEMHNRDQQTASDTWETFHKRSMATKLGTGLNGLSQDDLDKQIEDVRNNPSSPEKQAMARNTLARLKAKMLEDTNKDLDAPIPGSKNGSTWRTLMGDKNAKEKYDAAEHYFDYARDNLLADNIGAVHAQIATGTSVTGNITAGMAITDEHIARQMAIKEMAKGDPALQSLWETGAPAELTQLQRSLANLNIKKAYLGEYDSMSDLAKDHEHMADPKTIRTAIDGAAKNLSDMPDPAFVNTMNMASKSGSFLDGVSKSESPDPNKDEGLNREKIVGSFLTPENIERYKKVDPVGFAKFSEDSQNTVAHQLLPAAHDLVRLSTYGYGAITPVWDPDKMALRADFSKASPDDKASGIAAAGDRSIKAINMSLHQLIPLWKAEGVPDGNIGQMAYDFLTSPNRLGVNLAGPREETFWQKAFNAVQTVRENVKANDEERQLKPGPTFRQRVKQSMLTGDDDLENLKGIMAFASKIGYTPGGRESSNVIDERGTGKYSQEEKEKMIGEYWTNLLYGKKSKVNRVEGSEGAKLTSIEGGKSKIDKVVNDIFKEISSDVYDKGSAPLKYMNSNEKEIRGLLTEINTANYIMDTSDATPREKKIAMQHRDLNLQVLAIHKAKAEAMYYEEKMKNDPLYKKLQDAKADLEKSSGRRFTVIPGGLGGGVGEGHSGGTSKNIGKTGKIEDLE